MRWLALLSASGRACPAPTPHDPRSRGRNPAAGALVLLAVFAGVGLAQGQEQADLERAATRAAIEARDDQRIVVYGERVLVRQPDDLQILERGPSDPMEFTLAGLDGQKLSMASLKSKVVVLDFWATWCGPCRGQHPLYEQVKQRFKDNSDVVFLSIDTDEDREPVRRFLEEEKWSDQVYFEDGLSRALRITYIPTTIIIEKRGQVFSRMNGYAPERFVDLLTGRIRDALGQ